MLMFTLAAWISMSELSWNIVPLSRLTQVRVLAMEPETRAISPTEYEGVKLVSFGYAGQGSAIMRGPMVSGTPFSSNLP